MPTSVQRGRLLYRHKEGRPHPPQCNTQAPHHPRNMFRRPNQGRSVILSQGQSHLSLQRKRHQSPYRTKQEHTLSIIPQYKQYLRCRSHPCLQFQTRVPFLHNCPRWHKVVSAVKTLTWDLESARNLSRIILSTLLLVMPSPQVGHRTQRHLPPLPQSAKTIRRPIIPQQLKPPRFQMR